MTTSNVTTSIRASDLTAAYNGTPVLDGVNLEVSAGEWVVVIGPNGAGKTSLLRVVAGVLPAAGSVTIGDRRLADMSRREVAATVALVPQVPVVPDGVTVFDYVLLGRNPHVPFFGVESQTDLDRVREVLVRLRLDRFAGRPVTALSGGERQRVVLARALAQDADVLLLDEPTTALDLGYQQQALDLVDELRRDRQLAIVSTLHDLTMAGHYGDRLVLLDRGRVVMEGTAAEVLKPELIGRHFGADVRVVPGPDGPTIVPIRGSSS